VLHFHCIVTLYLFVIPKVGWFCFVPKWKLMALVMTILWHLPQFCQKMVPPSPVKVHTLISFKWAYKVVVGLISYLFWKYWSCLWHGCFYKKNLWKYAKRGYSDSRFRTSHLLPHLLRHFKPWNHWRGLSQSPEQWQDVWLLLWIYYIFHRSYTSPLL